MTKFLLSVHVLAAIVAIGPVTVAASMFPAAVRRAAAQPDDAPQSLAVLRILHRICRVYAVFGIVVPVFGFATASALGVLTDAWLLASMALTALAAAVLVLRVLPGQQRTLAAHAAPGPLPSSPPVRTSPPAPPVPARLAMWTGAFNLLWATVTVLMIVRPGSTTGV